MLEIYKFAYDSSSAKNASEQAIDFFNDICSKYERVDLVFSTPTSNTNYIQVSGKIWGMTTTIANYNITTSLYYTWYLIIDEENHFFAIGRIDQNTGIASGPGVPLLLGMIFYSETENGDISYYFGSTAANSKSSLTEPPFVSAVNTSSDTYLWTPANYSANQNIYTGYTPEENDFKLIPFYIGLAKIPKLYYCQNNKCIIFQKISDGSREFVCIGRQTFYELNI